MKIPIHNGGCALRFKCKNVNKKLCVMLPNNTGKVECEQYEEKE